MISIITITFNNFDELITTINSLNNVPPTTAELIIVNGGTCEKTKKFLDSFSHHLPFKIVQEKDRGITDAFNKGAKLASGLAITFLNSGDRLLNSNYYHEVLENLKNDSTIHFAHSNIIYDDQLCGEMIIPPRICNIGRGMPFHHQTMVVKKEVFEKIGYFNEKFKIVMDYDFTARMLKSGYKGKYLPQTPPPIFMDGHGVSALKEKDSILECKISLKDNKLFNPVNNFKVVYSFYLRYFLYNTRTLLTKAHLTSILKLLKKFKNS